MQLSIFPAAFVALSLLATPAFAQSEEDVMTQIENVQGDAEGFGEIFAQMQDAFLFDNPTSIADLGIYPVAVNANGESYDLLEAKDMVDNFDHLLTKKTQAALASQDFTDLIVTSEGVGFANGALWMANVCLDDNCEKTQWGIISINN